MPWDTALPVLVWFLLTVVLTALLWINPPEKKITALLAWVDYTLIELFFFWIVDWAMVNYYLRFLVIILIAAVLYRFWYTFRKRPWLPGKNILGIIGLVFGLIVLAGMSYVNFQVLKSYDYKSYPGQPLLTLFPLRNGMYVVANGGNGLSGWGMNDHVNGWFTGGIPGDPKMAYAEDIFELRIRGYLGSIPFPRTYQDYQGFMDIVYSPCIGTVVIVEDGHPDVPLYSKAGTHLGNYVVVQCNEYYITLGGMRDGSIRVKEGDRVSLDNFLGVIGNSSDPTIPHLHVHATVGGITGDPVPILHEGIFHQFDQFDARNKILIP